MADTTKGAVEIERFEPEVFDASGDYGFGHMQARMESYGHGDYVRYDDHARIIATLAAENAALVADAERYRWLRDFAGNQLYLTRNADHACNYVTAKDWIENCAPECYVDCDEVELQRMKDADTIWTVQVYPNTPIGFNWYHAATLDAAIDAALTRATEDEKDG